MNIPQSVHSVGRAMDSYGPEQNTWPVYGAKSYVPGMPEQATASFSSRSR